MFVELLAANVYLSLYDVAQTALADFYLYIYLFIYFIFFYFILFILFFFFFIFIFVFASLLLQKIS